MLVVLALTGSGLGADGLARAGVRAAWSASYGSFEWAEVVPSAVGRLRDAGVDVEVHPEAHTLVLPGGTVDPAATLRGTELRGGRQLALIQLRGPSTDGWLAALRARGAVLVQYVAPFSYVALMDQRAAAAIADLGFVRWVGPFPSDLRFGQLASGPGGATGALVLGEGGALGRVLDRIRAIAGGARVTGRVRFMDVDATGVLLHAGVAELERLAALPTVYAITPMGSGVLRDESTDQIVAGNYTAANTPTTGYAAWLQGRGVTGQGVTIAHVDTGFDATHPDLAGKLVGCRNYMVEDHACTTATNPPDLGGHGTHTAGIAVAAGALGGTDANGFVYGLGVAPAAQIYAQNFIGTGARYGCCSQGPGQYLRLNRESVVGGASVSANSWGPAGSPRGYDADTREFDIAPRDANLETPAHESLSFVLSIMNGNGGVSTQGTPDEGKNLLRVGSTESSRAGQINDLSSTSGHGPALDGRRLPDVVAPGEGVISTRSAAGRSCATPIVDPDGLLYASCTGTSMASPHVSGAAALFIEHHTRRSGAPPSPALVKAALVNGAVDLFGARDADGVTLRHIPDHKQGWGRLHLGNVLGGTEKASLDQSVILGETGASHALSLEAVDPTKPVKVTLAWTDALGHGLGGSTPAWVNDLDLRVSTGPEEAPVDYLGNVFGNPSTGWSVPGGAADFRNNLENVYLREAPAGPIRIEVLAANLAGDGVPGNGDDTDQDFALWVSNARLI